MFLKLNFFLEIFHWFTAKENDWGYANFLTWKVKYTCTCIIHVAYQILDEYTILVLHVQVLHVHIVHVYIAPRTATPCTCTCTNTPCTITPSTCTCTSRLFIIINT